jgi:hypothetical protein
MTREEVKKARERRASEMYSKYIGGKTMAEVGAEYGITHEAVRQTFTKFGFKKKDESWNTKRRRDFNNQKKVVLPKDVLIGLYVDARMSMKTVAAEIGSTVPVVWRNLIEHGIPVRDRATAIHMHHSPLPEELLRKLYVEEGKTAKEIARQFGYSPVTIKQRLWNLGIRKNPR